MSKPPFIAMLTKSLFVRNQGSPAGILLPAAAGLITGLTVLTVAAMSRKWAFMAAGSFSVALALVLAGRRWEKALLFLMIFVASFSVDINFFPFKEHVGGANGLRVSAMFAILSVLYVPYLYGVAAGREKIRVIAWVTVPMALYTFFALLSSFKAVNAALSLYQTVHLLQLYLLFLYLSNKLRTEEDLKTVLYAVCAAIAVQGLMVMAQKYTSLPLTTKFLSGTGEAMMETVAGEKVMRPSGFMRHPIMLGNFMILSVPIALVVAFFAKRLLVRAAVLAASLFGLMGLALTLSRGAMIGMGVALAILTGGLWLKRLVPRRQFVSFALTEAALAAVLALWKGKELYLRFTKSLEGPVKVRYELADIALQMIRDNPLLGVGINNFSKVVSQYERLTFYVAGFRHPVHNIYLLEFSETGVLGGVCFLLLLFGILKVIMATSGKGGYLQRLASIAILAGYCAFLVVGLAEWSYRLQEMSTILWLNLGVAGSLYLWMRGDEGQAAALPQQTGQP